MSKTSKRRYKRYALFWSFLPR